MIGGIAMVFAVIWMYQGTMKVKMPNALMWVGIAAVAFFVTQTLFDWLNIYILETFRSSESTAGYERDILSVGDRKNEGGFEGFKGVLLSTFFELMPPIAGFIVVAIIRTYFVLKLSLAPANLFNGLGDMFISIKDSFVSTAKEE
ncbi:MAG: hypothetical protein RL637_430 [Pseudomonadota bacterium]|jgi:hypothetical protein